ncbi:hypothetical protein K8I28_14115, partial [bacterium]|nr:hypothetical protein [bacterium]
MRPWILNVFLMLILLLLIGLHTLPRVDYRKPNVEFFPEMAYAKSYDAYDPNPVFKSGRTIQAPVSGTIARGYMPIQTSHDEEGMVEAGLLLENPLSEDAVTLNRGGAMYKSFCLPCHGSNGLG